MTIEVDKEADGGKKRKRRNEVLKGIWQTRAFHLFILGGEKMKSNGTSQGDPLYIRNSSDY